MIVFNIHLLEKESIPADRESWPKKEFQQEKSQYQGRSYEIHQVIERPLECSERVMIGLKALIAIIATLGIALIFSSTVRDMCSKAIYGIEREIYWKPTPDAASKSVSLNSDQDTSSHGFSLTRIGTNLKKALNAISAPKPVSLNFDRFNLSQGFSLTQVKTEEKKVLNALVETWKTRNLSKEDWSLSELANFLKQDEALLKKCFELVFLIPNPQNSYASFGLEKLFKALDLSLSNQQRLSFQPGVKVIWQGSIPNAAKIFGKGRDKENWKLEELGRFLAVSQNALIDFLGESKDQYSYQEIDKALRTAQNSQINVILEKNRTQLGSIRWGMLE